MARVKDQLGKPRKERSENAARRREQVLNATLRSIVQNGLGRTTLATVATEAGLSQGVAVFYFQSKAGLLTEALREHYRRYQENWQNALAGAGEDPLDQLLAVIRADFDPSVCNSDALAIWFAYWGEQSSTPEFAEISAEYDTERAQAIRDICQRLLAGRTAPDPGRLAEWIDGFTDAFWQRLHLYPTTETAENAIVSTFDLVRHLLPDLGDRIRV